MSVVGQKYANCTLIWSSEKNKRSNDFTLKCSVLLHQTCLYPLQIRGVLWKQKKFFRNQSLKSYNKRKTWLQCKWFMHAMNSWGSALSIHIKLDHSEVVLVAEIIDFVLCLWHHRAGNSKFLDLDLCHFACSRKMARRRSMAFGVKVLIIPSATCMLIQRHMLLDDISCAQGNFSGHFVPVCQH
jgi:hypothetical protein